MPSGTFGSFLASLSSGGKVEFSVPFGWSSGSSMPSGWVSGSVSFAVWRVLRVDLDDVDVVDLLVLIFVVKKFSFLTLTSTNCGLVITVAFCSLNDEYSSSDGGIEIYRLVTLS